MSAKKLIQLYESWDLVFLDWGFSVPLHFGVHFGLYRTWKYCQKWNLRNKIIKCNAIFVYDTPKITLCPKLGTKAYKQVSGLQHFFKNNSNNSLSKFLTDPLPYIPPLLPPPQLRPQPYCHPPFLLHSMWHPCTHGREATPIRTQYIPAKRVVSNGIVAVEMSIIELSKIHRS